MSVRISFPRKLRELSKAIEKELLLETELSPTHIVSVRFYINDYIKEIESFLSK